MIEIRCISTAYQSNSGIGFKEHTQSFFLNRNFGVKKDGIYFYVLKRTVYIFISILLIEVGIDQCSEHFVR